MTKILLCIAISSTLSYAMELIPLTSIQKKDHFQIDKIQDIPRLSLKNIRPCFTILSEKKRNQILATKNKNGVPLAESFTFTIAMLQEKKLIHTILTFMLDGDEKSANIFYKVPLWYAQKRYHHTKKMLERSSLIKQPIALLFRLPTNKQKEIMGIITPTFASQLINGPTIIIGEKEERIIKSYDEEIQNKFFIEKDIRVMTEKIERISSVNLYVCAAFLWMTGMPLTLYWMIDGVNQIFFKYCSNDSIANDSITYAPPSMCTKSSYALIAFSVPGFFLLSCIITATYCGHLAKKQAQKIEI